MVLGTEFGFDITTEAGVGIVDKVPWFWDADKELEGTRLNPSGVTSGRAVGPLPGTDSLSETDVVTTGGAVCVELGPGCAGPFTGTAD